MNKTLKKHNFDGKANHRIQFLNTFIYYDKTRRHGCTPWCSQ